MFDLLNSLDHNPFFSGGLTLMVLGSAVATLRRLPGQIREFLERRLSITVEIPDRDPAFVWVQKWLAEHRYCRRARDLSLTTTWITRDPDPAIDSDPEYNRPSGPASEAKFLLSPAPGMHLMTYRGRPMIVYRTRRELQYGGSSAFQECLTLQVIAGSRALVEAILAEAHAASFPKTPGVNILTVQGGGWSSASWQHKRPLGSIVLAEGVLEDLLDDLRDFYASSAWYAERGIPYRRGYLLHGPPGTGKTTTVLAVAGELNVSVASLSLSSKLMSDENLRTLVDALPAASILLIEDVDCVFKDQRTTESHTGVTLSGLLNALDGVSSREGRVLFLTTNHPDRLDPALIRPGRVDRRIELGHATPEQARRLFLWFYRGCRLDPADLDQLADHFADQISPDRVGMAAIQEHLLRHRRDPEVAAHEPIFEGDGEDSSQRPEAVNGWIRAESG